MPPKSANCLEQFFGKKVVVRLQGGRRVCGTICGYDTHLNISLKDTFEHKGRPEDPIEGADLGDVFVRGSMVKNIELSE